MDDKKMSKHNNAKLFLKIAGLLFLATGLVFITIAFIDFFSKTAADDMEMPKKFWMFFIGFPTLAIGGVLTMLGFKRGILTYVKNESIPVINEAVSDLDGAFSSVAHSLKKGLDDDKEKCLCGAFNKIGSAFCLKCGAKLKKKCGNCGSSNEKIAQYCNHCGNKL